MGNFHCLNNDKRKTLPSKMSSLTLHFNIKKGRYIRNILYLPDCLLINYI